MIHLTRIAGGPLAHFKPNDPACVYMHGRYVCESALEIAYTRTYVMYVDVKFCEE